MENKIKFSDKTPADKYLEYVNDWLTVERMAEHYGHTTKEMIKIIDQGKEEHELNCTRVMFQKVLNNKLQTLNYSIKTAGERFSSLSMNKSLTELEVLLLADDFIDMALANRVARNLGDALASKNK